MKFVKDGWHWLEVDNQGHIVRELTNTEHAIVLQQITQTHAHDWLTHFSLWWTHGSHQMGDWLLSTF